MGSWRDDIRQLLAEEERAWNAGDAAAFSEAVALDCVFTNIFGQVFVGKQAFQEQHARIFESIYRGSTLNQTVDHLRLLRAGVVVANTSATVEIPASDPSAARRLRAKLLQIFVSANGVWQIAAYHNVEERAPPGS